MHVIYLAICADKNCIKLSFNHKQKCSSIKYRKNISNKYVKCNPTYVQINCLIIEENTKTILSFLIFSKTTIL